MVLFSAPQATLDFMFRYGASHSKAILLSRPPQILLAKGHATHLTRRNVEPRARRIPRPLQTSLRPHNTAHIAAIGSPKRLLSEVLKLSDTLASQVNGADFPVRKFPSTNSLYSQKNINVAKSFPSRHRSHAERQSYSDCSSSGDDDHPLNVASYQDRSFEHNLKPIKVV
jgi:hypothetical protein